MHGTPSARPSPTCKFYNSDLHTCVCVCVCVFPDINECAFGNGGCEQRCTNTNGSYWCFCDPGHTIQGDGFYCQGRYIASIVDLIIFLISDVDECAIDRGGCFEVCINTIGSYICYCTTEGYQLHQDGHSCVGKAL